MMRVGDHVPWVSVVVPTFNRIALLEEAVRSALAQTWPCIEVLVIDDGGDPMVCEHVSNLANGTNRTNRKVRYIARPDLRPDVSGPQVCRNIGLAAAAGDFILFLDDDDLLAPHCIETRMQHLTADPALDFCVGQCRQFEGLPAPDDPLWMAWSHDQDDLLLLMRNDVPWQTSGPLWRKASWARLGTWDETLGAGHDHELHIRALAKGMHYRRNDLVDYFWRRPRADSYSGFERFKALHANGDLIDAFIASIGAIQDEQKWNAALRHAAWGEGVRLALTCRLFGGNRQTASRCLRAARASDCGSAYHFFEVMACNLVWYRIGARIPALSWAARRGMIAQ